MKICGRTPVISGVEVPNPEELYELTGKGFTKRVAPITAIFAVILDIAALEGNKALKEMLLLLELERAFANARKPGVNAREGEKKWPKN
jgi:hypothetical protein